MTQVLVVQLGLDFTLATSLRRFAVSNPDERIYVLSTKPGGAEHLVRALPNVDLLQLGQESVVNLAVHLSGADDETTVTIDGASGLARRTFPLLATGAFRVYRPKALTTPALHAEIEELDVSNVDRLVVQNALQAEAVLQMVPAAAREKVVLDLSWNAPDDVVGSRLNDPFGAGVPVVWYGGLNSVGSGFRDYARLFAHLPADRLPVAILQSPATPEQFDDLTANLGWSGALPRLMVFTAPTLEFVSALFGLVAAAKGVLVSTAIDAAPNPLMAYAYENGVPMVGYDNRAFEGSAWGETVATCNQGDILELAGLVSRAPNPAPRSVPAVVPGSIQAL